MAEKQANLCRLLKTKERIVRKLATMEKASQRDRAMGPAKHGGLHVYSSWG